MGLKTHSYSVDDLGLTIPIAYAKITDITIDPDGNANAVFAIQQSREEVNTSRPLEEKRITCQIDKTLPIYEQIYNTAKVFMFKDWEDDIVVDVVVPEPDYIEDETKESEVE